MKGKKLSKLRKITPILLIILIVLFAGSCRKNPTENLSGEFTEKSEITAEKNYLTLLYSSSDSFNPYSATTKSNRQISKLIYDPLIKTDNEFKPHYCIAQGAEIIGNECTVTLKNRIFSDGSAVTADDVIYSYNLAMKTDNQYKYKLYEVSSVSATATNTVVFKLSKQDPFFLNLIDFPIIKAGSEKRTDSDGVVLPPIGCGRYTVDAENSKLVVNDKSDTADYRIKEIRLINAPDSESISHYVEISATDAYFSDISGGNIIRMSGNKFDININHLIFLGVNHKDNLLKINEIRQAISSGIDRKLICKDCFYNNALPATGFFNPVWEEVKSVQNIENTANKEITVANLKKIGYNIEDNELKKINLTLTVNSENRMHIAAARAISTQMSEYGFIIKVIELKYDDYKSVLEKGDFQLYLGEVEITPNMDFSDLCLYGGKCAYGLIDSKNVSAEKKENENSDENADQAGDDIVSEKTVATIIGGFYSGKNSVSDLASSLQTEMPLIPVCYRTGALFYNSNIENVDISSLSDIYFSIGSYKIKK